MTTRYTNRVFLTNSNSSVLFNLLPLCGGRSWKTNPQRYLATQTGRKSLGVQLHLQIMSNLDIFTVICVWCSLEVAD